MKTPQNHASDNMKNETDQAIDSAPEPYRTPSEIPGNASDAASSRRTSWRWILLIGGIGLIAFLGLTSLAASVVLFGFERSGPLRRPLPNAVQGNGNTADQSKLVLQPDQGNENGD